MMLFRLVAPILRRNMGRTLSLILQFAMGSAVATAGLHLMFQEHAMMSALRPEWTTRNVALAVAPGDRPVPSGVSTLRYKEGQWRKVHGGDFQLSSDNQTRLPPWKTSFMIVNEEYVRMANPRVAFGRWLTSEDWTSGPPYPVVLNEAAASLVAPSSSPIGLKLGTAEQLVVVGVLQKQEPLLVRFGSRLTEMIKTKDPIFIVPHVSEQALQLTDSSLGRGPNNPTLWIGAIPEAELLQLSGSSLEEIANDTRLFYRSLWGPLQGVAVMILLLAGIGAAGLLLSSVEKRWREFGIRVALGATPTVLGSQLALESVLVTGFGGVLGFLLGRPLATRLPGSVDSLSPVIPVLITGGAILLGLALALISIYALRNLDADAAIRT